MLSLGPRKRHKRAMIDMGRVGKRAWYTLISFQSPFLTGLVGAAALSLREQKAARKHI